MLPCGVEETATIDIFAPCPILSHYAAEAKLWTEEIAGANCKMPFLEARGTSRRSRAPPTYRQDVISSQAPRLHACCRRTRPQDGCRAATPCPFDCRYRNDECVMHVRTLVATAVAIAIDVADLLLLMLLVYCSLLLLLCASSHLFIPRNPCLQGDDAGMPARAPQRSGSAKATIMVHVRTSVTFQRSCCLVGCLQRAGCSCLLGLAAHLIPPPPPYVPPCCLACPGCSGGGGRP